MVMQELKCEETVNNIKLTNEDEAKMRNECHRSILI